MHGLVDLKNMRWYQFTKEDWTCCAIVVDRGKNCFKLWLRNQVSMMNEENMSSGECSEWFPHGSSWNEMFVPPRIEGVDHDNVNISKQAEVLHPIV